MVGETLYIAVVCSNNSSIISAGRRDKDNIDIRINGSASRGECSMSVEILNSQRRDKQNPNKECETITHLLVGSVLLKNGSSQLDKMGAKYDNDAVHTERKYSIPEQ